MDPVLHSSERMDWSTPDNVLALVRQLCRAGLIAFDPCTDSSNPTGAVSYVSLPGDGLTWAWPHCSDGLTYVNPPYGRALQSWIGKCCAEGEAGAEIVLLVPARPDTGWFDAAHESANAKCEWRGRLKFKGAPSSAPFPSALFYWGSQPWLFCHVFSPFGRVSVLRERRLASPAATGDRR